MDKGIGVHDYQPSLAYAFFQDTLPRTGLPSRLVFRSRGRVKAPEKLKLPKTSRLDFFATRGGLGRKSTVGSIQRCAWVNISIHIQPWRRGRPRRPQNSEKRPIHSNLEVARSQGLRLKFPGASRRPVIPDFPGCYKIALQI